MALYARMTRRRSWSRPLVFTAGYLLVWGSSGLIAYGVFRLGRSALGSELAWRSGGRWFSGAVLALAAAYELTPLKHACLGKCRSPLGFLLGTWRDGNLGALEMGCRHAAWCLGCCWAMMVALFALGVMSLTWMALIAALIALEKTIPWRAAATWGTAALLCALAIGVIALPGDVPGLVTPAGAHGMGHSMSMMR
jgi:predicted metal-binding membrane protein